MNGPARALDAVLRLAIALLATAVIVGPVTVWAQGDPLAGSAAKVRKP